MSPVIVAVCIALTASCALTGVVRRYAIARGILDVPNARSSHTEVTPRGGGLAIAAVFLGGIAVLGLLRIIPAHLAWALLGGGLPVSIVGWLDDKKGVSAQSRAVVHFLSATWAVGMLGGYPHLSLGVTRVSLGMFGSVLAIVAVVWMVNLYNFMDGIDALAGSETVVVGLVSGVLLLAGGRIALGLAACLLAASAGGFLAWNWPPAKIFMGDVSSGLLGFTFGVLAVASENAGGLPFLGWVLLLSVFVVDATATLLRRILAGQRWYDAHRTHAYQLAVSSGYSHKRVTVCVTLINVLLAALGWTVSHWAAFLLPVLLLTVACELYIWWRVTDRYLSRDAQGQQKAHAHGA
jgi:Fuc2NAc and GlcNAc transferase